jgi:hypothetical protein
MIELKEPVTKEKLVTPTIIRNMQKILSKVFVGLISPYPTVAVVVTTKYKEVIY